MTDYDDIPQELEAERALIGSALISPYNVLREARWIIHPGDFYKPSHQWLWDACTTLHAEGHPVDPVTVAAAVSDRMPDAIAVLWDMYNDTPASSRWKHYVDLIIRASTARRLIHIAAQASLDARTAADPYELAGSLKADLDGLTRLSGALPDDLRSADDFAALGDEVMPPWIVPGWMRYGWRTIVVATEGVGKLLRVDEPILTVGGWSTMGALRFGDQVFDMYGIPCNVVAKSDIDEHPDAYRLTFSDGATVEADARHQWLTVDYLSRQKSHDLSTVTTKEIRDTVTARGGHTANHAVPVARALEFPPVCLPLDPYLLGVWLGDGTTQDGFVTLNRDDANHIEGRIRLAGWPCHRVPSSERPGSVGVRIPQLRTLLREMGLQGHKFIPDIYLTASLAQRLALLQGLMDTDGYCPALSGDGRGHGACTTELTFMKGDLPNGAAELIRTLGINPQVAESDAVLDRRVVGRRVRIHFQAPFNPFSTPRKADRWFPLRTRRSTYRYIKSVEPCEPSPMQCIQVDSPTHTYLAGRNLIPTHNSVLTLQWATMVAQGVNPMWPSAMHPRVSTLVIDLENPAGELRDRMRRMKTLLERKTEYIDDLCHIWHRPAGIDLRSSGTAREFEAVLQATRPALVVLSPLYKAFRRSSREDHEDVANDVTTILDDFRARYGFALIIEHHAPKGGQGFRDMVPFGSSIWQRWPEFGLSINKTDDGGKAAKVDRFRGDRIKTGAWPSRMAWGREWPWEFSYDDPSPWA